MSDTVEAIGEGSHLYALLGSCSETSGWLFLETGYWMRWIFNLIKYAFSYGVKKQLQSKQVFLTAQVHTTKQTGVPALKLTL